MEPKWWKNRCKNQSKIWCILGLMFERVWEDLGSQNGALLAPKLDQNSILWWKCRKDKNAYKTNGILMIFGVQGVQVGSKNRWKIDQKRRSTWEGILASIFDRFWWILGGKLGSKIEQQSIQKGIEKVVKKRRSPRWGTKEGFLKVLGGPGRGGEPWPAADFRSLKR